MASDTEPGLTTNKTAFVLGYTGETGKELIKEMDRTKLFKKVVLIGRREIKLDSTLGPEFEQRVVDFDNLIDHKEAFKGLVTGFCCLGTTKGKSGKEGFIKVDHDYVVQSAEVAKSVGCQHFIVMSSLGSNRNSCFLYARVKGEVEEELKAIGFDRLTILKPGFLFCDRVERRPVEKCILCCVKPFPRRHTGISTENLAKIMLSRITSDLTDKVEVIENKAMYDIIE